MTDLPLNKNEPTLVHIDLNSCFASIEQQANTFLRNKPVVVAAYTSPNGCVVSPSKEAKLVGIRVGMTVREARMLYREVIVRPPDPPKYRDVHLKFCKLFRDYSPDVVPKSIDEAVIDFKGTPALKRGLTEIAKEIKRRMQTEIGDWLTCSIGISTNRFLAKTAAGLQKPDGLNVISHNNIHSTYKRLELIDLCGINTRFQARLNAAGIFNPTQFLNSNIQTLHYRVFQSIFGYYWYLRLRGWEIDAVDFSRKSYGNSYALGKHTNDPIELSKLLMKLCEKTGRRMRTAGYYAHGIHVSCIYKDGTFWHIGRMFHNKLYTTFEIFKKAQLIFNKQPERKVVANLAVSCYDLHPTNIQQLDLFETKDKQWQATKAMDEINDRYGEYVITPALMMGMGDLIIDRISFGGVKELEELYDSIK